MAKTENFPEKERIRWHPKYSQNCSWRLYKADWKLPRVLPLELLATVKLRFTFVSSQSKSKSPSRSPRVKTRDCEMAPKNNKSKIEEGTIANMSIGWRKSKMSKSLVWEFVTPGLQKDINRAIIYVPGSSHTYIQQNEQSITAHIT